MNNNLLLLLSLVKLFLVLLIGGFSFILVNQEITAEEEPKPFCAVIDNTPDSSTYHQGAVLFEAKCASCHNKNMKADMTGPALGGVLERWNGDTIRLYSYIRNWAVYTKTTNDPYAIELENWDPSVMQVFPDLTDENIDAILEYIESAY